MAIPLLNNIKFSVLVTILLFLTFNVDLHNSDQSLQVKRGDSSLLVKRAFSGDATFYDVGLGSCGKVNDNGQMVAAISHGLYDSIPSPGGNPNKNKFCGRRARVTRGRKSVTVTVVDRCGGCDFDNIDLSPAAFNRIAHPVEGRVHVTWKFV